MSPSCRGWQAAAQEFCARHALPDEVIAPLAEHLLANLERVPGGGGAEARALGACGGSFA